MTAWTPKPASDKVILMNDWLAKNKGKYEDME